MLQRSDRSSRASNPKLEPFPNPSLPESLAEASALSSVDGKSQSDRDMLPGEVAEANKETHKASVNSTGGKNLEQKLHIASSPIPLTEPAKMEGEVVAPHRKISPELASPRKPQQVSSPTPARKPKSKARPTLHEEDGRTQGAPKPEPKAPSSDKSTIETPSSSTPTSYFEVMENNIEAYACKLIADQTWYCK